MKGFLYISMFFTSALFICCNKSSSVKNAALIGKWGLSKPWQTQVTEAASGDQLILQIAIS